jgi:YegS/Rv2252/BmrU family lipid kinase
MTKQLKIIANPISGSGRVSRFLEHLKDALAKEHIEPDIRLTRKAGDATALARDHSDDRPILCLGGDGTFNEVINGLMNNSRFTPDTRPTLGFIPFGSGNVIAKELRLKRAARQFIRLFQGNLVRQLDLGCVNLPEENLKRYFISMVGIGFDAQIARKYQLARKDGAMLQAHLFSYFPIALGHLFRYQAPSITIQADGKAITEDASFVQIANARSYGGPFVMVNKAVPDDNALDACWFIGKSSLSILLYYTLAFFSHGSLAAKGHQRISKAVISSKEKVSLQVDGDFCGYLPAEIAIVPNAVRVFTPV